MDDKQAEEARKSIEAGLRAIMAMVGTIFGLGIKAVFDTEGFGLERWPLFLIVTPMFSRFLIGAAVHITYVHVNQVRQMTQGAYILDVTFLSAFAVIGLAACTSESLCWLLFGLLICLVVALIWQKVSGEVWFDWKDINLASAGALALFLVIDVLFVSEPFYVTRVQLPLLCVLALVLGWLALADLRHQLARIGIARGTSRPASTA